MKEKLKLTTVHCSERHAYMQENSMGRLCSEIRYFIVYIAESDHSSIVYDDTCGYFVHSEQELRKSLREESETHHATSVKALWQRYLLHGGWR